MFDGLSDREIIGRLARLRAALAARYPVTIEKPGEWREILADEDKASGRRAGSTVAAAMNLLSPLRLGEDALESRANLSRAAVESCQMRLKKARRRLDGVARFESGYCPCANCEAPPESVAWREASQVVEELAEDLARAEAVEAQRVEDWELWEREAARSARPATRKKQHQARRRERRQRAKKGKN